MRWVANVGWAKCFSCPPSEADRWARKRPCPPYQKNLTSN